jgi:hypothetical protein
LLGYKLIELCLAEHKIQNTPTPSCTGHSLRCFTSFFVVVGEISLKNSMKSATNAFTFKLHCVVLQGDLFGWGLLKLHVTPFDNWIGVEGE